MSIYYFCLDRIVDSGNTVVIVEHNQQIINAINWIIHSGQVGGNDGGYVIAAGTPNDIKGNENSIIGEFCKNFYEVLIFMHIICLCNSSAGRIMSKYNSVIFWR
ncbi:MAG: hypothetical protein V8R63_12200 [Thomasclavelia ramosa]